MMAIIFTFFEGVDTENQLIHMFYWLRWDKHLPNVVLSFKDILELCRETHPLKITNQVYNWTGLLDNLVKLLV